MRLTKPWRWALGLLVAAALVWLVASFVRRGEAPALAATGAPAPSARATRRSAPRLDVTVRPRASISGRVLDPARQPVAGAGVCAWVARPDGLTTAQTAAPRCATTDAGGAYTIPDLLSATPLDLSAAAKGYPPEGYQLPDGLPVRLAEGEQRAGVDFVLHAGGVKVMGRVNDVTGGGVAGALVVAEEMGRHGRAMAKSDAGGEFTLWVSPGQIEITATAPGYAPGSAEGPAPGHAFGIYLVPGATLAGRAVIAGKDEPVADAFIEAIQMEGGYQHASTRTDDQGRFRVEGLLPGRYRVEATSEGREGYSGSSVTLGMGETSREVVVSLDPAYVVRGRVVDKASGEPCKGGDVTITDEKQNEFSHGNIEPDGWARMASVIPGNYRVEVKCTGAIPRDDYPKVVVKDRDAPELRWEVDRGASVRVAVLDAQGKPLAKASVDAVPSNGGTPGSSARPEADGTFLVAGLKPGEYSMIASSEEGGRADATVTITDRGEERLTLKVPAMGAIDGVVEDSARRPVAGVVITASGPRYASVRSLDDGSFSLTGMPSGEYWVAADESSSSRDEDRVKVVVTTGDHARVKLSAAKRDGAIEGRVIDESGQPVTDAFLDFGKAQGREIPRFNQTNAPPVITDTDGHFKIESLADGEYNLRAYRNGGGEAAAEHVKVGRRDVVLRLGRTASITGTVMARGAPVERFMLHVRDPDTGFMRSDLFFHSGGTFSIGDLPAGTYRVIAEIPDGRTSESVTIAEGEQKTGVALTVTLRGSIDGRVVDETGSPVAGLWVTLESGGTARSGPDGRFHLESLGGTRQLMTRASRHLGSPFGSTSTPVEVPEGGSTDVGDIRVPRQPAEQ